MKDLYGKKEKHDHKWSNLLKGCILAIVMLAPFFAILSKIVYVSANKNAKDSYYGETINEQIVNTPTNLTLNTEYEFLHSQGQPSIIGTNTILVNGITDLATNVTQLNNVNLETITKIYSYNYGNPVQFSVLWFYDANNTRYTIDLSTTNNLSFKFTLMGYENTTTELLSKLKEITYNKDSYLDNVFYYAIEQSKDEEILNWTKNTPIYNVINTMNTGLGLSNNHILTYLLTYWSIILAIYIVFDIIIFVFTKITHYLQ